MAGVIKCIADNVVSPLGVTSMANYEAVKAGRSGLARYERMGNITTPFVLSRIDRSVVDGLCESLDIDTAAYTFFEKMVLSSAMQAVRDAGIDASSGRVLFIFSTTKGNVSLLGDAQGFEASRVLLGVAARKVTERMANPNAPVVVCNACISGVVAQIEAMRALETAEEHHRPQARLFREGCRLGMDRLPA